MPALFDMAAQRAGQQKRTDSIVNDDSDDDDMGEHVGQHRMSPLIVAVSRNFMRAVSYSLVVFCMGLVTFCACVLYMEVSAEACALSWNCCLFGSLLQRFWSRTLLIPSHLIEHCVRNRPWDAGYLSQSYPPFFLVGSVSLFFRSCP